MKLDRVIAVRNSKTIYRDGEKCIKVFNSDYSKADVLNEALNQARIEETGLNIPKILEVTMIDGKWAIVSEFIKGKTLNQLMQENPDKKDEYLEMFVDLQIKMHSKTCPLLNKLKDKMNNKDTFILYIGNKNCHNCTSYEPVLKKVLNDYNITVYKLDNSKLSDDEFKEFSKYFSIQGTPTILFVNNGEEETTINRIVGNTSEKSTIERFKTNGYIK